VLTKFAAFWNCHLLEIPLMINHSQDKRTTWSPRNWNCSPPGHFRHCSTAGWRNRCQLNCKWHL